MAEKCLWDRMKSVADIARQTGHLVTINNEIEIIEQQGVRFVLRYAPQLSEKIRSSTLSNSANTADVSTAINSSEAINSSKTDSPPITNNSSIINNPFLPPEPELFVESVTDHYNLILNKFNVLDVHGLLTTKSFVDQTAMFTLVDFEAVSKVLNEVDGLVFYNGGNLAGASQKHRHFQLVPKNLGEGFLPVDAVMSSTDPHQLNQIFSFQSRLMHLPNISADTLLDTWQKIEFSWQDFNLLITRQWMFVVPRIADSVGSISVNSLAFAGAFLAKSPAEVDFIKQHSPISLLKQVSKATR